MPMYIVLAYREEQIVKKAYKYAYQETEEAAAAAPYAIVSPHFLHDLWFVWPNKQSLIFSIYFDSVNFASVHFRF